MPTTFSKPLLVIAGFPRTGTTSLYHNLSRNPGFATPARKELNFFCSDPAEPLQVYERHFTGAKPGQICVDSSPFYSLDRTSAQRIREAAPGARVVLFLRKPSSWMLSAYIQIQSLAAKPVSFREFAAHPVIASPSPLEPGAIADGMFRSATERFARAFGDDLLLADFAAFERDPVAMLQAIETFAGAAPYFTAQTADARAFNSAQLAVQSSRPMRRLLASRPVAGLIAALIPAALIKRVRRASDFGGPRRAPEEMTERFSSADLGLADGLMPGDTAFIAQLFAAAPTRRGSEVSLSA